MRITQSMMQDNLLRQIFNSQAQMDKYLTQITTGKKIRRPSEDPVVAMKGISYRTEVAEVEQYRRNASEIWTWMDHSDDVLDKASKAMQRIEELAIQAANDTYTPNERRSIQEEVKALRDQLVELANTQVHGKYIFNGTHTDIPRIIEEDGEFTVNPEAEPLNDVLIEVAKGIEFPANV